MSPDPSAVPLLGIDGAVRAYIPLAEYERNRHHYREVRGRRNKLKGVRERERSMAVTPLSNNGESYRMHLTEACRVVWALKGTR